MSAAGGAFALPNFCERNALEGPSFHFRKMHNPATVRRITAPTTLSVTINAVLLPPPLSPLSSALVIEVVAAWLTLGLSWTVGSTVTVKVELGLSAVVETSVSEISIDVMVIIDVVVIREVDWRREVDGVVERENEVTELFPEF